MTKPQIVVLDGYTLNPGDLDWNGFESLGPCAIFDRTPARDIVSRCQNATAVITNKTPLSAETIAALPALRYIGVLATGYNVVDIAAARKRGIPVTNIPTYGTTAVAQHAFALLLELAQHAGLHAQSTREGAWASNPDWCYWKTSLVELAGLKLGLVGDGRIGRATAAIGRAFGMEVEFATECGGAEELRRVLHTSDVVSLHCPLTAETRGLINASTLRLMKPAAFLINTSRGPLINEEDLANALNEERLAGAGLDVLSVEPPLPGNPLLSAKNCLITPHIAWAAKASRERLMQLAVGNLRDFLAGTPSNVVN